MRRKARLSDFQQSQVRKQFQLLPGTANKCQETASERLKVQDLDTLVLILSCYIRKSYSSSTSFILFLSQMGILAWWRWWDYMR